MELMESRYASFRKYKYTIVVGSRSTSDDYYIFGTDCFNDVHHLMNGVYKYKIPEDSMIFVHESRRKQWERLMASYHTTTNKSWEIV